MASKGSKAPNRIERADQPLSSAQTHTLGSVSRSSPIRHREISIQPGQTLAGRFRVERFLGSGGMGQVFAAQDLVLGEAVAVKVMNSVVDGPDTDRRRLVREVQLARRVTHRNVCRIFDLFQHHETSQGSDSEGTAYEPPPLDIVSMELLEGHNLTEHLHGQALTVEESLALCRQIARGLHAAHSLGIVHRDLKPGNIMLVQEREGLRVAVTDFGLAHQVGPSDRPGDSVLTEEGKIMGTPAYMAPEQVAEEPTSPATDIYALGIILFECLSGRLPFRGDTPWQLAISRLTTPPEALGRHLPELPEAIGAVVDRCLHRRPEDRFSSCREFLDALDQGDSAWEIYGRKRARAQAEPEASGKDAKPQSTSSGSLLQLNSESTNMLWWSAAALLAVLSLVYLVLSIGRGGDPSATALETVEPIAVGMQPDSPPEDHPTAVEANLPAPATEPRSIDASLQALLDHKVEAEPAPLSPKERAQREQALQEASSLLAAYEPARARRVLESALTEIPTDPLLKSSLAETLWRLGFEQDARALIENAQGQSKDLPREEKLLIEARHAGLTGDWNRARDIYKSLWLIAPKVDYGLWIVEANWLSGYLEPMPEVFKGIRKQLGDTKNPRIDVWESRLLQSGERREKALELAQRAVAEAERIGRPALLFIAQRQLASALRRVDRRQEGDEARRSAERILDEVEEHPYLQTSAWMLRADKLLEAGHEDEALLEIERADRSFSEIGSDRGLCYLGLDYGLVNYSDLQGKAAVLERLLGHCRRAGLAGIEAWVLHYLARNQRDMGEFRQAVELFFESGEIRSRLKDNQGLAQGWISLAVLLSKIGRVDEAMAKIEVAQDILRQERHLARLQVALLVGADTAVPAGRLDDAQSWLDQAEDRDVRGMQLVSLYEIKGKLAMATGDAESLWRAGSRLEEHCRNLNFDDYLPMAEVFRAVSLALRGEGGQALKIMQDRGANHQLGAELVRALIAAGDPSAARAALKEFSDFVEISPSHEGSWSIEILTAELELAEGNTSSLDRLSKLAREAQALGHQRIALQADLVRLRNHGSPKALEKLRKRAEKLGFKAIAAEAAAG